MNSSNKGTDLDYGPRGRNAATTSFGLSNYLAALAVSVHESAGAGGRPGGALQGATRGLLAKGRAPDTTHHTRSVMPDFTSKMLNGFPPGGNAGCFDGRAQI